STQSLQLAQMPSGTKLTTPLHIYEGDTDGPVIYIQAAQHGREINGTETLRRLHTELKTRTISGTVYAVPIADPLTFDLVSYTTPEEFDSVNPNMNRVWPGDSEGTLHERMAAKLWEYATKADGIIDLHTGSPNMVTHVVFMEGDTQSREMAEAFGSPLLLSEQADEAADEEWHKRDFSGKFRVVATKNDIPTITPELAHNKQIIEQAVDTGVTGILNILIYFSVLEGDLLENGDPVLARNHLGRVKATDSGLFRLKPGVTTGQEVSQGDILGHVFDPQYYDSLQEVTANRDGILYGITKESTIKEGDTLARIALPRE
ncbi:MAG: succinylglutamate desuccinylase/aspartoacylase family protein, partial [Halobacteriaceae archaeon]